MGVAIAVGAAGLTATVAWILGTLTVSGAGAATFVGTLVVLGAGWPGALVLVLFFVSSSAVSHATASAEPSTSDAKSHRRDAVQVWANGGAAAVGAFWCRDHPTLGFWILSASLAAAGADTWATSLGALSRRPPRDALSGRVVLPGTSGGVTYVGTIGGAFGGAIIAVASGILGLNWRMGMAVLIIGWLGMLGDSALGAACQGKFFCESCQTPSERRVHRCGQPTRRLKGWQWFTNDGVNAVTTLSAALVGWWMARILAG